MTFRQATIDGELASLERQKARLQDDRRLRSIRMQARLDLAEHKAEVHVEDTLSSENKWALRSAISSKYSEIDSQRDRLIANASELNYSTFTAQLELALPKISYCRKEEVNGLQAILKLMQQHKLETDGANRIERQLNETVASIRVKTNEQVQNNEKRESLRQTPRRLTQENDRLAMRNSQLEKELKEDVKTYNKLVLPGLILLGLTVVTGIPLILALSGVFSLTTAGLTALLITNIPTLIAAIGVGIGALVYSSRISSNKSETQSNITQIAENKGKMKNDLLALQQLEQHTIPDCTRAINELITKKEQTDRLLQQARYSAQKILEQAQKTYPFASVYPSFVPSGNAYHDAPPPYPYGQLVDHSIFNSGNGGHPQPSAPLATNDGYEVAVHKQFH